jgi:hypothetical protein
MIVPRLGRDHKAVLRESIDLAGRSTSAPRRFSTIIFTLPLGLQIVLSASERCGSDFDSYIYI